MNTGSWYHDIANADELYDIPYNPRVPASRETHSSKGSYITSLAVRTAWLWVAHIENIRVLRLWIFMDISNAWAASNASSTRRKRKAHQQRMAWRRKKAGGNVADVQYCAHCAEDSVSDYAGDRDELIATG